MSILLVYKYLKLIVVIVILVSLPLIYFFLNSSKEFDETNKTNGQKKISNEEVKTVFTHRVFDPALAKNIVPLGELNGGYNEVQAINGVMIQMKGAQPMEVYAPIDMSLKYYSYAKDPMEGIANYQLTFTISKDLELTFHHITEVNDELKEIATPTENSGAVSPSKKYSIQAGELLAKTTGTGGHNWNIYLSDKNYNNEFVNFERYKKLKDRYAFLNAVCPFDPYEDSVKSTYLALMGATASGQSATCGTNTKDVRGSISGLWYLSTDLNDAEMVFGKYEGKFATPFSIYKDSAGRIVIYEVNRQRYLIGQNNATYKDPAEVIDSHCYNLTEYPEDRSTKGYLYFKIVSDMEMKMSYGSGACPVEFPESGAAVYYR